MKYGCHRMRGPTFRGYDYDDDDDNNVTVINVVDPVFRVELPGHSTQVK